MQPPNPWMVAGNVATFLALVLFCSVYLGGTQRNDAFEPWLIGAQVGGIVSVLAALLYGMAALTRWWWRRKK